MKPTLHSRRIFIKQNAKLGLSAALSFSAAPAVLEKLSNKNSGFADEPIIDIHQHTNYSGRSHEQMIAHQRKMGISKTILLPAGRPVVSASTHEGFANGLQAEAGGNESCYALAQQYPGEFYFAANEVPDIPEAVSEIEKYLKLGAKIIAESKFGVACDSPEMQKIFALGQEYDVPVLMHWQHEMYNYGFDRFYKMLEKYPKVNFIGHAQTWWANIDKNHKDQSILYPKGKATDGGITDRLLSDYPNMYGDMSAGSGLNALLRDEEHAIGFMERHQDKLLYGSDCNDEVGEGKECQGTQTIATIKRLAPSNTITRKLLYENARELFKL
ncbi:amidohydrolase family protein [Catalinimonas sp. 4WD22]|uniref:amidohydrolase family protein n=1 Tax=Catalinimonas locisalis TaxID=3133978 RepID=UPI0031011983